MSQAQLNAVSLRLHSRGQVQISLIKTMFWNVLQSQESTLSRPARWESVARNKQTKNGALLIGKLCEDAILTLQLGQCWSLDGVAWSSERCFTQPKVGTTSQNFLLTLEVIIKKQPYKLFSHVTSYRANCPISSRNFFENTLLLLPLLSKEELILCTWLSVALQALTSEVICSLSSGHLLLLQFLLYYFTAKLTFIALWCIIS